MALPAFLEARGVLAYLSFGTEFPTLPFVNALLARGCDLALPKVDREKRRLAIYLVKAPESDTTAGVWGIREPDPLRCAVADLRAIDAVLVPGVAFSRTCERLGYGGGYYDRLLGDWPERPPLVAAAFELQVCDELPVGPNDCPVDLLVTEQASYRRAQS